jgi:hypothetical protein
MSKTLKTGIILLVMLCLFMLVIMLLDFRFLEDVFGFFHNKPGQTSDEPNETDPDLTEAVQSALLEAGDRWLLYEYQVDHIQIQEDGVMAIVWLVASDPDSGELIGREPELALAKKESNGQWKVLLTGDDKFNETFMEFQYAEKHVEGDLVLESEAMPKSTRVFGGYYLPWAQNLEKRLTWSVGHTSCYPIYYCTHAFDFADGTMFPMVASKGGTVYHWKDTCSNGDPSCTNSITIQDRSTTPWTYQLYLHIAQNSVPSNLKKVGTPVMQGQFIANVDDTGYSTGHHVHFMVVTEDTKYLSVNGYVWGVAEDITFRDVDINWDVPTQGGRPRLAYEADTYGGVGRTYYISGNKPANPPTGGLTAPEINTYITDALLQVSGWGDDDIAVTKMEILANYGSGWVQIGDEQTTSPFTSTVDLCETSIPDGLFKLGLRVWDYEGNPSSVRSIRNLVKDIECGASGTDPNVKLILNGGVLALPQEDYISASATKGSTKSRIVSVEFWMHTPNWKEDSWVKLGKDTNGTNGWQVPISTTELLQGRHYTVMAIVKDALGNQDVDYNANVIVDHTNPEITLEMIPSPIRSSTVTLRWSASDGLSGLNFFNLSVSINGSGFEMVAKDLPGSTRSYVVSLEKSSLHTFAVTAYDKSGNVLTATVSLYTDGYEFPFQYIFPIIYN